MSLVTIAEIQALGIGLGLSDTALQAAIDREEAELVRRFGSAAAARTEILDGGGCVVLLRRQISAVSAVTESVSLGDTPDTLTTTDYHTRALEGYITRLPKGQLWGCEVNVTYTPIDDTNLRKAVLIELVRISTEQAQSGGGKTAGLGFSGEDSGSSSAGAWAAQRDAQYARMGGLVP